MFKKIKNKLPKKLNVINQNNPSLSTANFQILNIGNQNKVKLMDYIKEIEKNLNLIAKKLFKFTKEIFMLHIQN